MVVKNRARTRITGAETPRPVQDALLFLAGAFMQQCPARRHPNIWCNNIVINTLQHPSNNISYLITLKSFVSWIVDCTRSDWVVDEGVGLWWGEEKLSRS